VTDPGERRAFQYRASAGGTLPLRAFRFGFPVRLTRALPRTRIPRRFPFT